MKKTIIALMALAGVSMAADEDSLLWSVDFTGGSYAITTGAAWGTGSYSPTTTYGSQDFTTMPGYLYANGDKKISLEGNAGLMMSDSFSLSMEASITSVYTPSNSTPTDTKYWLMSIGESANWYIGAQYDTATKQISVGYKNYTMSNTASYGTFELTDIENVMLTMSGGLNEAGLVTVYVNGAKAAVATMAASNRHDKSTLSSGVAFMNYMGEHDGVVGGVSSVSFYNKAIPEPTTATLSLLALAGLAVRRRRK